MSGIEVVGLVLGAFPLCISAMEHYEDTKKVSKTWWTIRRAHKKDLGKVKDCQLKFRLNLKELLLPLLLEEVVNQGEYEFLIANPGGAGWKEDHVEEALKERLSECHERYLELLEELAELMGDFSKAVRVNDAQFQEILDKRDKTANKLPPKQQAQTTLMVKANVAFEAKRLRYALTGMQREDLLKAIEAYNTKLQDVLSANDRVSAITQSTRSPAASKIKKKALTWYCHAASIFRLFDKIWSCTCKSKGTANLWLQHHAFTSIHMDLNFQLCHKQQALRVQLSDTPPSIRIGKPGKTVVVQQAASKSGGSTTATLVAHSTITTSTPAHGLDTDGLCQTCCTISGALQPDVCLGRLDDDGNEYAVFPASGTSSAKCTTTNLAELLASGSRSKFTRVQRHCIALALASSHLQLHSTPWLKNEWTSRDVCFASTTANNVIHVEGEPHLHAKFGPSPSTPAGLPPKDRSFSTLGIVLLELCFGCLLEEHRMWQNSLYAPGKADPIMRQTVACEWLDDVYGEAGEDYAMAVNWTLKQAPPVIKDEKWRADFAENVVQPLQRCYESLSPRKPDP